MKSSHYWYFYRLDVEWETQSFQFYKQTGNYWAKSCGQVKYKLNHKLESWQTHLLQKDVLKFRVFPCQGTVM